jgi:hypothetical protein
MKRPARRRLLFLVASPVVLVTSVVIAGFLLPGPRPCPAISCGPDFNSDVVDVFGSGNFTLAQTVMMAIGIWVSALLLALAAVPTRVWLGAGFGLLVLAALIAWALPSPAVGPEPSVLCFTPDTNGQPIAGRCATGPAPTDARIGLRLLVVGVGVLGLGLSALAPSDREAP